MLLCRVMKTARSSYYAWVAGPEALGHEITVPAPAEFDRLGGRNRFGDAKPSSHSTFPRGSAFSPLGRRAERCCGQQPTPAARHQ